MYRSNTACSGHSIKSGTEQVTWIKVAIVFLGLIVVMSPEPQSAAPDSEHSVPPVLANGQFVRGPNMSTFHVTEYIRSHASHLLPYSQDIHARSLYYSINPKVYLTLMQISNQLLSNRNATQADVEKPFGLDRTGFLNQLDQESEILNQAFYYHLNQVTPRPVSLRQKSSFQLADGSTFPVSATVNAATYAMIAGLAQKMDSPRLTRAMDQNDPLGFYQTYVALFPGDDPLSESNHIYFPGEQVPSFPAVPPAGMLQLPYPRGEIWYFGGVHNSTGSIPAADMSSLDWWRQIVPWGADTSTMWVVASAPGTPFKITSGSNVTCGMIVDHTGGWSTAYYHLDNVQTYTGQISQNDPIGVLANTSTQATCAGGSSTGPHAHFTLMLNGAYYALNGTALSGWTVHSGTESYDCNHANMWLENNGVKKYCQNALLNPNAFTISGRVRDSSNNGIMDVAIGAGGLTATTNSNGNYVLSGLSAGTHWVGASKIGYMFMPLLTQVTLPPDSTGIDFVGDPVYSISGRVTDTYGHGIPNVLISGTLFNGNTDTDGYYMLTLVTAGIYTITPSRSGYNFSPPSHTVPVPPSAVDMDFQGTNLKLYLPLILR